MSRDSVRSAVATWQTYVPEGALFRHGAQPSQQTVFSNTKANATPAPPPAQAKLPSLQDDHWKMAQQATARLEVRSTGARVRVDQEPEAKTRVAALPQPQVAEVQPMEDTQRRDADLQLFMTQMERRPARPSTQLILEQPPPMETLRYCAQFKTKEMPWYVGAMRTVANHPDLTLPRTPLYTRAYLAPFWREPDPRVPHERPCFNLDREPFEGEEGRVRCIAHFLSEKRLGPGNAYRLRELLNTTQCTQINAALARKAPVDRKGAPPPSPCIFLNEIPGICVMCHFWLTTLNALDQKNHLEERAALEAARQNAPSSVGKNSEDDGMTVLNAFMVDIDKEGEYDRHCLLAGDDVGMGIYGPFPLFNERNYVPWVDPMGPAGARLRGFAELERMLFRPAPDPSARSTPMLPTAKGSRSPQ